MMLLLAGACFGAAVVLHGLLRPFVHVDSVRRFLLAGIPVGILLTVAAVSLYGWTPQGFAAIALYAFLCELYIFSFTLVLSSISATTLVILRRGPLPLADLSAVYKPEEMVQLRVARLLDTGFLSRESGRVVLTAKALKIHAAFSTLSRFFGHASR